ncbi:glycosyltransferase family 2 protein [Kibdelosporangium persicum]|uniref:Glycosyltransferase n=1 Tax=Kibdelosporangium persicum TaxID=2698649 RepID=A0ABX2F1C1_9PSEU|nr:glycosyltransferase family 2 protein [Kibdelosporangium persicum]NRN64790.1 putative glycosyltransferase [Kibdelosporangium persicum]
MRTTVAVVTWRGRAHIESCLDALAAQERPHRILVVDNASDDGTRELVLAHPSGPEVLTLPVNKGYAGGIQAALDACTTPYLAWLNDDAMPSPGWLGALEDALDADPRIAAASAKLLTSTGEVQSIGVGLTRDGHGVDVTKGQIFGFCGGAALTRVAALHEIGGVPAEFFCYYEDTDTSWRLRRAGWQIVPVPGAEVLHLHGATAKPGSRDFHRWNERNRLLMLLRNAPLRIAAREVLRFAVITALIPVKRSVPDAANFETTLRLGVLGEVLRSLPRTLRQRSNPS